MSKKQYGIWRHGKFKFDEMFSRLGEQLAREGIASIAKMTDVSVSYLYVESSEAFPNGYTSIKVTYEEPESSS